MSYIFSKREVLVATDQSLATATDIGDWAPGMTPWIIRAVALVFTTDVDDTGVVKVDKRPTAGSDSSRGDGDIATINYTTSNGDQGKVIYKDGLNVEIKPGEEVVFQVTDATPSTGKAHLILFIEPKWELPANNTDMSATT